MNQKILELLDEKRKIERELDSIIYGEVEIRQRDQKKYLFVHFEKDKALCSKYVGKYTLELNEEILRNNKKREEMLKRLELINEELNTLCNCEISFEVKRSVLFARENLVDIIYNQSILERIEATYSDTKDIIDKGKTTRVTPTDILKIVNLKNAWDFILDDNIISVPGSFAVLTQINKIVEDCLSYNAGKVRNTPVFIGGTKWIPTIPIEYEVKEELKLLLEEKIDIIDKAINALLYIMKRQIFRDGNKRTAVIFANHLLISNCCGLISIPASLVDEFRYYLISYYEGKDTIKIKKFLKEKCYATI